MTTVLFVLTSHSALGATGRRTGFYLGELAHPYHAFRAAGFGMMALSPAGGEPPIDQEGLDPTDPEQAAFFLDREAKAFREGTVAPSEVDPAGIDVVYYVGGHGMCWDVARDGRVAQITNAVWNSGGVVGAVCHGVAGLIPVRLSGGEPLVAGRRVTGSTTEEDAYLGLVDVLPMSVEHALMSLGAVFEKGAAWQKNVVVDGQLVTGQSAPSSRLTAARVVEVVRSVRAR